MKTSNAVKVFVYWNLHRKTWSIKALNGPNKGRVINHTNKVALRDCEFRVSEAGRQRVIKEQRKNVHAGCVGYIIDCEELNGIDLFPVTYNPYKFSSFVDAETLEPVRYAPYAILDNKKVTALIK